MVLLFLHKEEKLSLTFYRKKKIIWRFVVPIGKNSQCWKFIKTAIKLIGIKMLAVKIKPIFGRQILWIKNIFPKAVIKTGATY